MKPKPFTLGRLLSVRRMRQRRRQQALADAMRQVRQQEAVVAQSIDRQVAARDALREVVGAGRPGRVDLDAARRSRTYLAVLSRVSGEAAARLPALRRSEAAAREDLIAARRATRGLESLRDRRQTEERQWRRRREQRTLDECATAGLAPPWNLRHGRTRPAVAPGGPSPDPRRRSR